jgi:hypothetical protein
MGHFLGAKVNLRVEKVVAQSKYPAKNIPHFLNQRHIYLINSN